MASWHSRLLALIQVGTLVRESPKEFREHAMAEQAKLKADPIGYFYQGGAFCSMEFDGDRSRIVDWSKR